MNIHTKYLHLKTLAYGIQQYIKEIKQHNQTVFIHGCKASRIFENQSNTPHDTIMPISTERSSGKIQQKLI